MSNWKMTLSENSSFEDPHLRFLENFESHAESAGALVDGANVVRTETGNYFNKKELIVNSHGKIFS